MWVWKCYEPPIFDGWNPTHKLDAGWPESEEEQVGNVKLEEEVRRRSKEDNQVKTNAFVDKKTDRYT